MSEHLTTVRDYLRYAVSRFREAKLAHGHGAASALDEAAFIILEALNLPIDDINPWLDARLTASERARLIDLIEARIATRKPAAYLLGRAYIQGVPFHVDERVIVPRSFIGELLAGEEGLQLIEDRASVRTVLDLCTGSGCLAVLAAMEFPGARVDAVDISPEALDVARLNVVEHQLADRIVLHLGDLFAPLEGRRYDLIITNPPYVDAAAMAALPPEYRHEPAIALSGGGDGLDIVRRILAEAPGHLAPSGGLLCEIGAGRNILERDFPDRQFLWLDTEESQAEVIWITGELLAPRPLLAARRKAARSIG